MSRIKELLCVSKVEIHHVRRVYDKTENDIEEDLNILLDWLNKQPHLPKYIDRARLERFLLRNKFRIEQTKMKLDNYYSFKLFYSDFYTHLDPDSHVIQNIRKSIIITPMPKLLPSLQRILYIELVKDQEEYYNYLDMIKYCVMLWEFQMSHDYNMSEIFVCNAKNLSLKHITKMDANTIQKSFFILQHGYSGRLFQIHYVSSSPSFEFLLNLLKRILSVKLLGKIKTHSNFNSLHEVVPKEYLPEEAEGNMESARNISDKWFEEMILQKEFLKANVEETSNEKLRIGKSIHSDLFGTDGTFRKINID